MSKARHLSGSGDQRQHGRRDAGAAGARGGEAHRDGRRPCCSNCRWGSQPFAWSSGEIRSGIALDRRGGEGRDGALPFEPVRDECDRQATRRHESRAGLSVLRGRDPSRLGTDAGRRHARIGGTLGAVCSSSGRKPLRLDTLSPRRGHDRCSHGGQPAHQLALPQAYGSEPCREPVGGGGGYESCASARDGYCRRQACPHLGGRQRR